MRVSTVKCNELSDSRFNQLISIVLCLSVINSQILVLFVFWLSKYNTLMAHEKDLKG